MNTEELFATENQNLEMMEEDSDSDSFLDMSQDLFSDEDLQPNLLDASEIYAQEKAEKIAERQRLIDALPLRDRLSQRAWKLVDPVKPSPPVEKPPPKKLTDDQIKMREEARQALLVPQEIDTYFFVNCKVEENKDDVPSEVRALTATGFISAKKVHEIFSQVKDDSSHKGTSTPKKTSKSARKESQKVVRSIAQAVIEDFDDLDCAELTKIEEESILDHSLGSLTQKLSTSQRAADLLDSALSQNDSNDLDITRIDLEGLPSDDEEEVCTESVEFNFLYLTQTETQKKEEIQSSQDIISTQAVESDFLELTEQIQTQSVKLLEEANHRPTRKPAKTEATSLMPPPVAMTIPKREKLRNVEDSDQDCDFKPLKLEKFSGSTFVTAKSLQSNEKNFQPKDLKTFSKTATNKSCAESNNKKSKLQMFDELLALECCDEDNFETPAPCPEFSGFAFASGKNVVVKEATLEKFNKNFERMDAHIVDDLTSTPSMKLEKSSSIQEEPAKKLNSTPTFTGFGFASGKGVTVKSSTLKSFDKKFQKYDDEIVSEQKQTESLPSTSGFSLASGKSVAVKESSMNRIVKTFQENDQKIVSDLEAPTTSSETPTRSIPFKLPSSIGSSFNSPALTSKSSNFSTPTTSCRPIDSPLAKKLPISTPQPCSSIKTEHPGLAAQFFGFSSGAGKAISINPQHLRKISNNFLAADKEINEELKITEHDDDAETPVKPSAKKIRLDFGTSPVVSSPFIMSRFKLGINQHSTPLINRTRKLENLVEDQELSTIAELVDESDDDEPTSKRRKVTKTRLLNKFNDSADSNNSLNLSELAEIESIELEHISYFQIPAEVKTARLEALEEQKKSIGEKADSDKAQMAGTLFMMKSGRGRKSIKDFVGNEEPKSLNRHLITMSNALDYKFVMRNHIDENDSKTKTQIILGDNARLVLDVQSKVGIEEIKWSFLASPGVDPKLAKAAWIENAFKMIVLKFAWLENSFEKFDRFDLLSPENILLQLKYRYDREIDKHHRPAIKKICELDDVPCRRMVLKVVDIHKSPGTCELELSDGWYSIRTTIDGRLADAVERNKIIVGTKLITSLAELIGCNGCDPLELQSSVRLKIHANATRVTTCHTKLGFCKNPNPFCIPLESVLAAGGIIGKLRVIVIHVYQVVFVDSSGETKVFRSEKLQRRLQNKRDILNFSIYERIAHQVQEEVTKETRARVQTVKLAKLDIKNLSPNEVLDLLECECDYSEVKAIQFQLSAGMKQQIETLRCGRIEEVNRRIRQKMGEEAQQVKPLMKFRVVDARHPNQSALVSCWTATEELMSHLKIGNVIEIVNATAGPRNKEIQVTVGKSSRIKLSKTPINRENFSMLVRTETPISQINEDFKPLYDEFDIVCIIVRVDPETNGRQKVFVTDENLNILCLNFWSSLGSLALDDLVMEGKSLIVKNLQWRASHSAHRIPQGFVSGETTIFLANPIKEEEKKRLEEFVEAINSLDDFIKQCNDKFAELKLGNVSIGKENLNFKKSSSMSFTPKKTSSNVPVFSASINKSTKAITAPATPSSPKQSIASRLKRRLGGQIIKSHSFNAPKSSTETLPDKNTSMTSKPPQRKRFKR